MQKQTDTRWSPWHVIDGNDPDRAAAAALAAIAAAWEAEMPLEPPHIVGGSPRAA